jgi:pimeloyl-ACP methyl ester carboxylesterase
MPSKPIFYTPPPWRSRLLRFLRWTTAGLVGLAAVGALSQHLATRADTRRFPPPGQRVDLGGRTLHLRCQGEGSPTVVLEAGATGASPMWGWIQPDLARHYRVCAYDRAGLGWSEPTEQPRDALHLAEDLHTLLERARVPGPYVLVGHSLGGLLLRVYVDRYPEQVVGMAFIDPTHPDQRERFPEDARRGFSGAMSFFRYGLPALTRLGVPRATGMMDWMAGELPPEYRAPFKAQLVSTRHADAAAREWASFDVMAAQVRATRGLGALPFLVISASESPESIRPVWGELQRELATLSTRSRHLTVAGADHGSLLLNPEHARQVAAALRELVEATRESGEDPEPALAAPVP